MGQERIRVSAEIPVRWDSKGTSCKLQLKVLLLQEECPAGWVYVHKGTLKARKMATGAGSSRTASDGQRHCRSMLWKRNRGKGEGRDGTNFQGTGPWSGPKLGCPGGT